MTTYTALVRNTLIGQQVPFLEKREAQENKENGDAVALRQQYT